MFWMHVWLATVIPALYLGRQLSHASSCDGCTTTFWWRLRRDFWLSRPGRKGDLARISRVRQYVRHYTRMERYGTIVSAFGLNTLSHPFRLIANEGNYQSYEKNFIPAKNVFWIELVCFALWPISIPLFLLSLAVRIIYVLVTQ